MKNVISTITLVLTLYGNCANAGSYQDFYCTTISKEDRSNSKGLRLTSVAQIIQNERANFHLGRHIDPNDQTDISFADPSYRAAIPKIITANSAGPILSEELIYGDDAVDICVMLDGADMPALGMRMEIWRNSHG